MKSITRFSKNKRGIECLNCKQPLSDGDNFCSNCGQVNDLKPLSVKQFVSEFFSGFFSFDSRFTRTVIPLLLKPGKVSKEYIEGKRMLYTNPFRLYLNISIIFFLLQGLFSTIDEFNISESQLSNDMQITSDSTLVSSDTHIDTRDKKSIDFIKQKLSTRMDSVFKETDFLIYFKNDSLTKKKKDSIYNTFQLKNMAFITEVIETNSKINWNLLSHINSLKNYTVNYTENTFKKNNISYNTPGEVQISLSDEEWEKLIGKKMNAFIKYDSENSGSTSFQALTDLKYKKTRWNAFLFNIAQNFNKMQNDSEFSESYFKSIISKISIALFFLLPVFTFFLSLLYLRHKWSYTEHLIFVFNTQTVFFLLLIIFTVFDKIFDTGTGWFILLFLIYLFKALHNFYGQHRPKTFVKFLFLNSFYFFLSAIGLTIVSFLAFIF